MFFFSKVKKDPQFFKRTLRPNDPQLLKTCKTTLRPKSKKDPQFEGGGDSMCSFVIINGPVDCCERI